MKFGVEGHDNLEKDMVSKAVLNKDNSGFQTAKMAKSKKMAEALWKKDIEDRIGAINNKLDAILELLANKP